MNRPFLPKIWVIFFFLMIVLFVASLRVTVFSSKDRSDARISHIETVLPSSPEENATQMLQKGNNGIYVTDQLSGASQLTIGYVVFEKPGFVVIRKDERGMPGNVIGVSERLSGRRDQIPIALHESLQSDRVYYAELVVDDGDGQYREQTDQPVYDGNTSIVLMSFVAK